MDLIESDKVNELSSRLKSVGLELSLSKFVALNFDVLMEMKKSHIPLKTLAQIIEKAIGKPVSPASLSVAISRIKPLSNSQIKQNVLVIKTANKERFVPKDAILMLGAQKEIIKTTTNGLKKEEEVLIDWRGLAPNETISTWVKEYKTKLIAINLIGWRWQQIARAVSEHLDKNISTNTLTSIICLANKKKF